MSTVFISHHSSDGQTAGDVHEWLTTQGHRSLFLDFDPEDGIPAGRNWEQELYQQLRSCRAVIVLCSENAMKSKWVFAEMTHARALGKHIIPVKIGDCAVDPLISDRQVIDMTLDREEALARLWRGLLAAGIDPADVFDWDSSRPPYPGLISFQEADAAIFFGRDKETTDGLDLLNRVRRQGSGDFVMVLGSSGSGKSSLVRAGLVPHVRQDTARWLVLDPVRPRNHPTRDLSVSLMRAFDAAGAPRSVESIRRELRESDTSSIDGGHNALAALAADLVAVSQRSDARLLVIIDQFEELLGYAPDDPASQFLGLLRTAATVQGSPLIVLGTMRSDFLAAFQNSRALQGVDYQSLSIGPLTPDAIAQVIQRPAEVAGLELESGLTELMVADTRAADALPLLAFTLRELYEKHGGDGRLDVSEYRDQLGGLNGAIAKVAEETLASQELHPQGQAQLRNAFMSMVRLTDDARWARRAMRWDELPETIHPVLESFVKARLLVAGTEDDERTIEVAHEALFWSWDQLSKWLGDNASDLRLRSDLVRVAESWDEGGRSDDDVWRGGRLERVDEMLNRAEISLDDVSTRFVEASHRVRTSEQKRRRRRWRLTTGIAAAATVLALVASVFFVRASAAEDRAKEETARAESEAERAEQEAERAERTAVIALARQAEALSQTDPALAIAIAAEARGRSSRPETERALLIAHAALRNSHLAVNLAAHAEPVVAVGISPSGTRVVTGSWDGTARIWDAATGELLVTVPDQNATVSAVEFSEDGSQIATGTFSGSVRTWDAVSGDPIMTYGDQNRPVVDLAFSPDGTLLATAGFDATARIFDVADGRQRLVIEGHTAPVPGVAFSPDGRMLATGSRDATARVWDAASGEQLLLVEGHDGPVVGVAFSPDGQTLATGSWDTTARTWSISTGAELQRFLGHDRRVIRVAFFPDGMRLATTSWDTTAKVWDVASAATLMTLDLHTRRIEGLAMSRDGTRLLTASWDTTAKIWDVSGGERVRFIGHADVVRDVAPSSNGAVILTGSSDGTARLWDAATGDLRLMVEHAGPVHGVAFDPDGSRFATASADRTIKIWDAETGDVLLDLARGGGMVQAVAFSADGSMMASAHNDGTTKLWDAADGSLLRTIDGHTEPVLDVAFHPDGTRLATTSADGGPVRVWDVATGDQVFVLSGHRGRVQSVAFSPDGLRVATASWDETARVWDATSGAQLRLIDDHADRVFAVAFNEDSSLLATGGLDGSARIWDVETGEAMASLVGHVAAVGAIEFLPGAAHVVTASNDGTVRVWDITIADACGLAASLVTSSQLRSALADSQPTVCTNLRP